MTAKHQSGATPRKHDQAFKEEAVRLWRSSGQAAEITAQQLGISVFNLYKWGREGGGARAAGALRPPESKEHGSSRAIRQFARIANATSL